MLTVKCLVNSDTFICIDLPFSTLILSVISSSDAALLVLHDWTRSKNSDERYSSYRKRRVYGKGILKLCNTVKLQSYQLHSSKLVTTFRW